MIKRLKILLICLVPCFHFAQDYSANWKGYFSYYDITEVVKGGNKIYAAGQNAIFTYDIQTKEYGEVTSVNGLSGESISTIFYSEEFELLLIGYENGLIEIVFDNDEEVLSVVDILGKAVINDTDKRINHFNVFENVVYISTNYGISVFDLERLEFGDTYFIGNAGEQIKVSQTAVYGGELYAACQDGAGIRKGDLSSTNLVDYRIWQTLFAGSFTSIQNTGTNLYITGINRRIYNLSNGILSELSSYSDSPIASQFVDDKLLVRTPNDVFVYDSDFNLITQISGLEDYITSFNSVTLDSDNVYIGTKDFGVIRRELSNNTVFEELHPQCPLLNAPFSLQATENNLWVTYGDHSYSYNPYPLNSFGFSHLHQDQWTNIPYSNVFDAKCLNGISVNPFNTSEVFISSFFSGLLKVEDDIPIFLYNERNSGLESLVLPGNPNYIDVRVGASAFDENGVLWCTISLAESPLKSFNPSSNQWMSHDIKKIIPKGFDNVGFHEIVVDPITGTKFMASFSKGVIGYNENEGGLLRNISEDENLADKSVRAVAVDKRGQLWIGTRNGLRVIYNTSSFFTDENLKADEIIILEGGIAKELLAEQFVTDIKVDGSNNKWIGTTDSGIFYLSSDGQKTVYHFTKENSPLPSNIINDISIDASNGEVYFATSKGLVSFSSGGSSTTENLNTAYAYPNPVRPSFNMVEDKIKIKGVPENVNIKITDISGNLVAEAQSKTNQRYRGYNLEIDGGTVFWNGKNLANNTVASGVYLIMLSDLDSFETKVLKLMIVR